MSRKKTKKEKIKQSQKNNALLSKKEAELPVEEDIINEEIASAQIEITEPICTKPKRIPISKQLRFEIFKRDKFSCQYCGRNAPDVILNVDHIKPVAEFGTNEILNLITSCFDCNNGKRAKLLSDDTVIKKQQSQLEELQERKEQIEMMFEWKKGLLEIDEQITNQLADYWEELATGYSLNESGKIKLKELSRKYQLDELMTAMKIACEQYMKTKNGKYAHETVEIAWKKLPGICYNRKIEREKPEVAKIYHIKNIMEKIYRYVDDNLAIKLMKKAYKLGASLDSLEDHARTANNWNDWEDGIETFIEKNTQDDDI